MNKAWYKSKTVWINVLSIVGVIFFGGELSPETVVIILGAINFILRLITKENIVWQV